MRHAELETYRLRAKLPVFRRHIDRALEIVRQAQAMGDVWACCVSGGKDSTVLADLCQRAGWHGPLFHFRHPETPPENTDLCWALAERYGLDLQVAEVPGAWDVYERAGHFFSTPESIDERRLVAWMLKAYKREAAVAASRHGHDGQFWGLRREESRARAIILAKNGAIYGTADRHTITACPLKDWSAQDVWAYTLAHDLPWLETYDKGADRERGRSEVTWLASDSVWAFGQAQAMRREDPARWAQLCERLPGLERLA